MGRMSEINFMWRFPIEIVWIVTFEYWWEDGERYGGADKK